MKLTIIPLLLLLINNQLFSQADSSYFPLQIGNYWEYWGSEYGNTTKKYAVVRNDTLMSTNGKRYFAVYYNYQIGSGNAEYWRYYRNEGDSLLYMYTGEESCRDYEQILYNFSLRDSSKWPICGSIFGNRPPEINYYYAVYNTFMDYYLGFSYPLKSKAFTNVVIKQQNGISDTIWNPYRGIGTVIMAKGLGEVLSFAELSPLWRLTGAIINGRKYGAVTVIENNHTKLPLPEDFSITAYPNPFNPSTTIIYALPKKSQVELSIYDIMGNEIQHFNFNSQSAGNYKVEWNAKNSRGNNLPSGTYIYRLKAIAFENGQVFEKSAKMLLVK